MFLFNLQKPVCCMYFLHLLLTVPPEMMPSYGKWSIVHAGVPSTPELPTIETFSPRGVILELKTRSSGRFQAQQSFGFIIRIFDVNSGTARNISMEFRNYQDGEVVPVVVGGLTPERTYQFTCAAFNDFGESGFSPEVTQILPGLSGWPLQSTACMQ